MADETIVNGEALDRTVDISGKEDRDDLFVDFDNDTTTTNTNKVSDSNHKIAAPQQEKTELVHENEVISDRINKLKEVVQGLEREKSEMKREIQQSEDDKKALESIAARAAQLETEVSRLQHDLLEADEANAELLELKKAVQGLKKSDLEKGSKVEILDKERNLLLERLERETSERVKVEEESKGLITEKETEIHQLKKWIEEMDSSLSVQKDLEIERLNKEIEELQIVKNETEALFKKSERKVKEIQNKTTQLQLELEGAEKTISGLKEKVAIEGLNGNGNGNGNGGYEDRGIVENGEEEGLMGLKLHWPIVAASAGAFAAVAVVYYIRYGKQS